MDWYVRAIETGAPWSFVLLFGQIVLLARLVERTVFLLAKTRVNLTVFLEMLKKLANAGNVDRAVKLTQALDAPVGRVCRVGLESLGKAPFFLSEELDRAIAAELPAIRRRIGTLPLLSLGVAALGLVGSVLARDPSAGSQGRLPLALAEAHPLAVVGVASGIVGLLWGLALASKSKRVIADLGRCKAFVLDLDT